MNNLLPRHQLSILKLANECFCLSLNLRNLIHGLILFQFFSSTYMICRSRSSILSQHSFSFLVDSLLLFKFFLDSISFFKNLFHEFKLFKLLSLFFFFFIKFCLHLLSFFSSAHSVKNIEPTLIITFFCKNLEKIFICFMILKLKFKLIDVYKFNYKFLLCFDIQNLVILRSRDQSTFYQRIFNFLIQIRIKYSFLKD